MNLFLDFETRSKVDLRKHGAYRYFEDPSTEALCASWTVDHHPGAEVWKRTTPALDSRSTWLNIAADPSTTVVAHNAEFERLALKHLFHLDLPPSRFRCTAAQSRRMSLPGSLDEAGKAVGLKHLKQKEKGNRVINKLGKPRRPSKSNPDEFWNEDTAPADFADLYDYGAGDTEAHRELFYTLPQLSDTEQAVWELTVEMNDRGLKVDQESVRLARVVAAQTRDELERQWEELTGVPAGSPKAASALGMASLAKAFVRDALRKPDLDPKVRRALEIRQRMAKSSVRKLATLVNMTCSNGRYRGGLLYAGAERTLRWSGRGVQLQNLPRGLGGATDLAFEALGLGLLPLAYDDILKTVSEMLKGFFVGPFLVGDFAQIEARALVWLAGQLDVVRAFANGEDVYCRMASRIYGRNITKSDGPQRQMGKVAVLGCGYGIGATKFRNQLHTQFDTEVTQEEAERVVKAYRDAHPRVKAFWYALERAFGKALAQQPGAGVPVGYHDMMAWRGAKSVGIELPSGRTLCYYDAQAEDDGYWPSGDPKVALSYFGRDLYAGGAWGRVRTYSGKIAENVTQAFSRDILVDRLLALRKAGFHLALTVHDEAVSEDPADGLPEFNRIMQEVPEWAEGLPLAVEGYACRRYRK